MQRVQTAVTVNLRRRFACHDIEKKGCMRVSVYKDEAVLEQQKAYERHSQNT
jgi:hypothetical protein